MSATTPQPTASPEHPAYHYKVTMTCGGCSGAINRVLTKNVLPPNYFHVSLPTQNVVVWGNSLPEFEVITEKIAKTGKKIESQQKVTDPKELPALEA